MAVDMFAKFDGIESESVDSSHKGEIDVLSWSWGVSQSGTAHLGGGAGAGKASVQDLSMTKYVCKASPELIKRTCNGKHIPTVVLTVRKAGEKPLEYLVITLTDVLITSVSTGGSGGEDRLVENLTLNFAMVKVEYTEQAKDGSKGKTVSSEYNIAENVTA